MSAAAALAAATAAPEKPRSVLDSLRFVRTGYVETLQTSPPQSGDDFVDNGTNGIWRMLAVPWLRTYALAVFGGNTISRAITGAPPRSSRSRSCGDRVRGVEHGEVVGGEPERDRRSRAPSVLVSPSFTSAPLVLCTIFSAPAPAWSTKPNIALLL
jgi:hypothetical protein